ncbi:MAG: M23 family metallopeptidase [Clostridia bacterium]|nr:M23 family metallopeptidase [Clostridia bacterium]
MARTLRDQRINQFLYYSIGGVIVAIILFIIIFNTVISKKNKSNNMQLSENNPQNISVEEANSPIGKKFEESKEEVDNTQVQGELSNELSQVENEVEEVKENAEQQITETANEANQQEQAEETVESNSADNNAVEKNEEEKDPTFVMPVEGEIVKHYGKDKLIYSNTLQEWTTHLGIDIKADKTTVVKASADGTVKSIKNDPRYGLTIVVEHANGFTSVYSNLLTAEFVIVGENVKSGQTLGTVGNSATFEILDDSHLHFEMLKDGNSIDPEMYIK